MAEPLWPESRVLDVLADETLRAKSKTTKESLANVAFELMIGRPRRPGRESKDLVVQLENRATQNHIMKAQRIAESLKGEK